MLLVPHSTKDSHLLLWHPIKKELWLLVPTAQAIWRVDEKTGDAVEIFDRKSLGLEDVQLQYSHAAHFYFDTARQTPVWLISTYDEVIVCALGKKSFERVETKGGITPHGADGFVFDPIRKVLVHFVGTQAMSVDESAKRAARGGLTVRELGVDGTWRDVGTPIPSTGMYTVYGWDEALGLAVYVDDTKRETWGWKGAWKKLGDYPTFPWNPFVAGTSAKGELVIVQKERGQSATAQCMHLVKGKWAQREVNALEEWGGMARNVIVGPWFGPGTVQHTLGTFDGKQIAPAGIPVPTLEYGSISGPIRFFGSRSHAKALPETLAPIRHALEGKVLKNTGLLPEGIAHHANAVGEFAITADGTLIHDGKSVSAPKGFVSREVTNFGSDGAGTLLVMGGQVSFGAKFLTDVWQHTEGKWTRLQPTGAAPSTGNAAIARLGDGWLVLGGVKEFRAQNFTSELTGNKWSSALSNFSDEKRAQKDTFDTFSLFTDSVSGRVICVRRSFHSSRAYAFEGKATWRLLGAFEGKSFTAFAWDQTKRTIVGVAPGHIGELALSKALDALKPIAVQTVQSKAKTKLADEVWLRLRQGERDLFWFARKEKTGWLERSGVRGAAAKEKRHAKGFEDAVHAKLAAGYEHSSDKEKAAIIPGRTSFRFSLGKSGDDLFGGVAPGMSAKTWPVCRACETPMTHVVTFNAHPERLPLTKHVALSAFICTNEETAGSCETWDPTLGSNAVVLLTSLEGQLAKAPGASIKPRRAKYKATFEPDPSAGENVDHVEVAPKLGGYPGWLQGDDTPGCTTCKKPMRFVAQFSEFDEPLNFASGDAFIFVCESEHSGVLLLQR